MVYPLVAKGAIVLTLTAVVGLGVVLNHLRKANNGDVPTDGQCGEGSSREGGERREDVGTSASGSGNNNEDPANQAYATGRPEEAFLLRHRAKNHTAKQPAGQITVSS